MECRSQRMAEHPIQADGALLAEFVARRLIEEMRHSRAARPRREEMACLILP